MFTADDYNSLHFKGVMDINNKDLVLLRDMPRFEGVSLDSLHKQQAVQIIKFFVLLYDKGSPLQHRYSDLSKRKDIAIELAGIHRKHQKPLMDELISLSNSVHVQVISEMLRKQADHSLSLLHSQEQLFYELLYHVMEPIQKEESDKDKMAALEKKAKLSEQMEDVSDRIEKYRAKYFRGDSNLEKKIKSIRYSPEMIAKG